MKHMFLSVCIWIQLILLKTENNKKIIFLTVYYCSTLFIGLKSLFMINEQYITHGLKKRKLPKYPKHRTTHTELKCMPPNTPKLLLFSNKAKFICFFYPTSSKRQHSTKTC